MADEPCPFYEYIVVGCGGIGSAAVYWLSKITSAAATTKGIPKCSVLGLEQFTLGHSNGSSQDNSRIIRMMYDDDKYATLIPHHYDTWAEVEKESGLQLVYKTGSLVLSLSGTPGMEVVENSANFMSKHKIPFEWFDTKQLRRRFPQFTGPENVEGVYQADGGLVDAALANAVHIQLARANGAVVRENCSVTDIITNKADDSTTVVTTGGKFRCRRVIVTSGAWSNRVLGSVGVHIPLVVTQEQVTYYATPNIKQFTKEKFPIFVYYAPDGCYYGLPIHGNSGTKIGIDAAGYNVTTDTRNYVPDAEREQRCENFLKENIPQFLGPKLYTKTCLYDMTYDRHFVIDTLAAKGHPEISFFIGSGHAFKFASLIGKILAELAVTGSTNYNISEFTMNRDAIVNPAFQPVFKDTIKPPPSKL